MNSGEPFLAGMLVAIVLFAVFYFGSLEIKARKELAAKEKLKPVVKPSRSKMMVDADGCICTYMLQNGASGYCGKCNTRWF